MNTTKVELPDGRLLKIEGGDAESTAKLLVNHYLGQGQVENVEEVLPVPGLGDFHESSKSGSGRQPEPAAIRQPDGPIRNVPVSNEGDESPLEVPVLSF